MTHTLRNASLAVLAALLLVAGLGLFIRPAAAATVPYSSIVAGDLVRSSESPAVFYVGRDGFRHVFPNSAIYSSWYANFDSVKWLSVADLARLQIGDKNVTYKPGVRMIKITSTPEVYAIGPGGTLRHITSEAVARALYGSTWNKMVDDLPDSFWSNYTIGTSISDAADFNRSQISSVASINDDRQLIAPTVVTITDSGFSPSQATVPAGTPIKFVNNGSAKHSATGNDGVWGTGTLNAGDSFIKIFKTSGAFSYTCSYHPNMTGSIIVQ